MKWPRDKTVDRTCRLDFHIGMRMAEISLQSQVFKCVPSLKTLLLDKLSWIFQGKALKPSNPSGKTQLLVFSPIDLSFGNFVPCGLGLFLVVA